jgi:hypothetical protein
VLCYPTILLPLRLLHQVQRKPEGIGSRLTKKLSSGKTCSGRKIYPRASTASTISCNTEGKKIKDKKNKIESDIILIYDSLKSRARSHFLGEWIWIEY